MTGHRLRRAEDRDPAVVDEPEVDEPEVDRPEADEPEVYLRDADEVV